MEFEGLKVGELARRTGLTVRTLHHYDAIGLLKPSGHTASGYRLYMQHDIARLQQVISLRQLGFSLEEIAACLDRPGFSAIQIIDLHLTRLAEQIELQGKLRERLQTLAAQLRASDLRSAGSVSADEFLGIIQETNMLDTISQKYFTPEQMQSIQQQRDQVGFEHLDDMQESWADVIAMIRAEMERETDPADPKVQELARRWQELINKSTGGDPSIKQSMKRLWQEQGDTLAAQFGEKYDSRPIWSYIDSAILRGKEAAAMKSFASFDGTTIAYSDDGDGPAVILLHGFGMGGLDNFGHFDRLLPKLKRTHALIKDAMGATTPLPSPPAEGLPGLAARLRAAGARVILPDLRGFGASGKPRENAAYANWAMARDVIALIAHLGLDAVDVLGFSMGGCTAARLLALGAPQIRTAILSGIGQYILEGEVMDLPKEFPFPAGLSRPFTMRAHAEAFANSLEAAASDTGKPKTMGAIFIKSSGADPKALAAAVRGSVAEEVPVEPLRRVTARVLVLNGKADLANQHVARLLEVIPNAQSHFCEGDHHSTPWYPSFQEAVANFFAERWEGRK